MRCSTNSSSCCGCKDGHDGLPGLNGLDGLPGLDGHDGLPGLNGHDGLRGREGMKGNKGDPGIQSSIGLAGGETYVRWGRTTCPTITGTSLVYSGWAAGSLYRHSGSGSNYLCLTTTPQYLSYGSENNDYRGLLYGAEYEAISGQPYHAVHNHDVPCAVCHVVQRSVLMIPGQYTCPTGWTREYYGYLVSEYHEYHRSTYECMDISPETSGSQANEDGALFHHVEARCGSLACPPYEETKKLTCAVCSK